MDRKTRKLLEQVQQYLLPGEQALAVVGGAYIAEGATRNGILLATQARLVIYGKKLGGVDLGSYPYEQIVGFESTKSFMGRSVTFTSAGMLVTFKWVMYADQFDQLVNVVQAYLAQASPLISEPPGEPHEVVGTDYHHGIDSLSPGVVPAQVRREPGNSNDPNAIAVWAGEPLRMTGYIPRGDAARHAPHLDAGRISSLDVPAILDRYGDLTVYLPALPDSTVPVVASPQPQPQQDAGWEPVTSWGRPTHHVKVTGSYVHLSGARIVVAAHAEPDRDDSAYRVPGLAIRSEQGISILMDGYTVGHLDAANAATYAEPLGQLARHHQGLAVTCDLWLASFDPSYSSLTVHLPEPDEITPPATLPTESHVVLPGKSKIQVTGEDAYLNELTQILAGESHVPVAVTLHETAAASGRGKPYVEVRISGDIVGKLTPTMSEHMLPIIRACAEEHLLVVCRAAVEGNHLKADVVLDTTKSGDLSQDWILEHVQAPDNYEPSALE